MTRYEKLHRPPAQHISPRRCRLPGDLFVREVPASSTDILEQQQPVARADQGAAPATGLAMMPGSAEAGGYGERRAALDLDQPQRRWAAACDVQLA